MAAFVWLIISTCLIQSVEHTPDFNPTCADFVEMDWKELVAKASVVFFTLFSHFGVGRGKMNLP